MTLPISSPRFQDYAPMARAVSLLLAPSRTTPSLEALAAAAHLSSELFLRRFTDWAGCSPTAFRHALSASRLRRVLLETRIAVLGDSPRPVSAPSSPLFRTADCCLVSPFPDSSAPPTIRHSIAPTPFGDVLIASTDHGICHLAFVSDASAAIAALRDDFPRARHLPLADEYHRQALARLHALPRSRVHPPTSPPLSLHLCGTEFQRRVWTALLSIPRGGLLTYGDLATLIGQSHAARAVGTAVGRNPVAFLIPCHRVVRSTGALGGYRWGEVRKASLIGCEASG